MNERTLNRTIAGVTGLTSVFLGALSLDLVVLNPDFGGPFLAILGVCCFTAALACDVWKGAR